MIAFVKMVALKLYLHFVHLESSLLREFCSLQEKERQAAHRAAEVLHDAEMYGLMDKIEVVA